MQTYKIVKLINLKNEYRKANLDLNTYGIEIEKHNEFSNVIFFNPNNINDYAYVEVDNNDIIKQENFPENLTTELITFLTKIKEKQIEKTALENNIFKEFDQVELISETYLKHGIKKNQKGVIAHEIIINNQILVDFTGINQKGEFFGDTILVNINDLKKI